MSKKNEEKLVKLETTELQGEQMNTPAAGDAQTSLSSSSSSSTEFIKMEELSEELNAIIGCDEIHRDNSGPTPTGNVSKTSTVGERLMSIAASAARLFGVPRLIASSTQQSTTTNPIDKSFPFVMISHVSAKGIQYVKISEDSQLGVFQSSVRQLEKYSAEFVQNRREVIVHTFPPHAIGSTNADEQLVGYYAALLSTIGQTIHAINGVSIGTALESLSVTAGSSETVNEHTVDAAVPIPNEFAGALASQMVDTIGGSALRLYKFVLIRLRFVNVSHATQFRNAFNGPALKVALARFILAARLPYCHFAATTPERRLRAAMLAQCARLNNAALQFAAAHGFAEPTRVKHVTNGTYIFKKIDSPYGPVGSVKMPIDARSPLGQMRGSIFTLIKYSQIYLTKKSNLLIRNMPESLDLSAIHALLRRALADNQTKTVPQIVAIERIGRQAKPTGQLPRLVRIVLCNEHEADALRAALNHKINVAAESSEEFHALKAAGTFVHGDLSPPELAFQRRLREFCYSQNARRDNNGSDGKRYRYFYRDTTLMRVPRM